MGHTRGGLQEVRLMASARATDSLRKRSVSRETSSRETSPNSIRDDQLQFTPRPPKESSGVKFYPPSETLWRIGGKWYDFEPFLQHHPGGAEVVRLARDRFEDSTFAFESHHHNYSRARTVIAKYEVPAPSVLLQRPPGAIVPGAGGDGGIGGTPALLGDDSFYSVARQRLSEHLRRIGCPAGGPTQECVISFWVTFAMFCASWVLMFVSGHCVASVTFGLVASVLGAFGHNWVHQPRHRLWSYLSLDTIGFSSTGWFREHVLQHHMYTNTPWDNHFRGTDPFLVTDPTVERHWIQRYVLPYINPIILTFGLPANFFAHLVDMIKGNEEWRVTKLILPANVGLMVWRWGLIQGGLLSYTWMAVLGNWYFTMALMNHNGEHCMDVKARNAARDWGEQQLVSCADWATGLSFRKAWIYLWLNYHTVHHLFPKLDMSHHPAAQQIIIETAKEFGVTYVAPRTPWTIYCEMVHSFSTPRSLFESIMVYGGGL